MSTIRHLIEHLAPLIFGAILGWLSIDFKPEHAERWVLAFVILFFIYSSIFEVLKRLLLFRLSQTRKICGVYAEVYSRETDSVVVAPFLVLHDLVGDEMRVFGRAFLISAHGIEATPNTSWKATAISVSEPNGSTREAQVERVVHLGFEVRCELVRDDGEEFSVQLTREQAATLELERGQIVYARPVKQTVFTP